MNKPRTRKSIFWSQSKLSLIDALQNSDLAFSTHFEEPAPNKFEENKVSSPETVESATVSSSEKVPGYGMQSHAAGPSKFTPRRLFQMAIANEENHKVSQSQALSSPRMLKEYKYKRGFGFASIVEQAQQQAHQNTLFSTSQPHTTDFNFPSHEFMDSPALTFSPSSYTPAESPDVEIDSAKLQKRRAIRRILLATYFLGIIFSERNRVKAFGPMKGRQTVISGDKGVLNGEKTGLLPLMPGHLFNIIWSVSLFFLLILSIILTPVSISFISDDNQTFKNIDLFFTIGFGIDIIINFLSAYQESKNVLQTDMRYIALNYLKGWFWIDLLAVIPFDIIFTKIAGTDSESSGNGRVSKLFKLVKFSRLSRLLRVLRLFKLFKLGSASQTIKKTFNKLKINMAMMGLLKIFGLVLAVNHLFGCLWFISARFSDFGPDTWVARESLVDADAWTQYLASYYWASQTLTTVGYGDISAETATERILAILWMIVGVGFYSFTIGNLSSFLADSDRRSLALQNKLMAFNTFAKNARLSEFVRQKIQTFYEQNHKENVYCWIDPSDLLTSLPTPLKKHLLFHSYYPMIQDIHLLKMDVNFTIAILLDLKVLKLAKGDILYREEDPSAEVYFVCKGSVNLISEEGDGIFSFVQGTYFGELEIFKKTTRASFCEAAEPTKILACDKNVFLKALEKYPKIKTFIIKNTNVRSEIFENKMSAIKDRHQPKAIAKSAPDLARQLRNDARRQTKKLLKSSVYFLNMLQKTQKKNKLNDIPEEGTPKSSKTNQSMNSSSLFNWVSNRTVTPRAAIGKVLKVLKRSSEALEGDSAAKNEKDIKRPQKTVSHPQIKMDETTSMANLLDNNTSITPINSMTTVGSQKASGFGEKKLQIKGSINLDDESPHRGGSSGSGSPVKSLLLRNRSLSPMNIFKKKVAPLQGTADPTNSKKISINRSASEDSVSGTAADLPKIQITPTSEGQKSPFKVGISPFAKRGSWIGEIKTKMHALNELEKDKIIPEEPSSTTSKVSKFPISKGSLDENLSPAEPKISISDHAYFKKLTEKFNQVYKLREKNESIIQELKSKKEEVNENISDLLSKQAELDVMIKKLFELRNGFAI